MKIVTQLEMDFLNQVKRWTEEEFSSDDPMWAYISQIKFDSKKSRALITTLSSKGILKLESSQSHHDSVSVNPEYWYLVDDIAEFKNLEIS